LIAYGRPKDILSAESVEQAFNIKTTVIEILLLENHW
jgi:hypothetical protein